MFSNKAWRLYCEVCNYRQVVKNIKDAGLHEVKRSPILMGIPKRDPENQQLIAPEARQAPKKLRCPKCGRQITPRPITDTQAVTDEKLRLEELQKKRKAEAEAADAIDGLIEQIDKKKQQEAPPSQESKPFSI